MVPEKDVLVNARTFLGLNVVVEENVFVEENKENILSGL